MAGRAAEMVLLPLPSIPNMQTWRLTRAPRFLLGLGTQTLARKRGSPQPAGSTGSGRSSGPRRGRTPRCYDRAAGSRRVPGPRSESSARPGGDGGDDDQQESRQPAAVRNQIERKRLVFRTHTWIDGKRLEWEVHGDSRKEPHDLTSVAGAHFHLLRRGA